MSTLAVRCTDVHKSYGSTHAVRGLSLAVERGECFGLLGPNGAGKTTTMEIIEGLLQADEGQVEILGQPWGRGDDRRVRQRIGVHLQDSRFVPNLTVRETVRLYRSFYERGTDVESLIDMFSLGEKRDRPVGTLSMGQRQRCALACALAGAPDVLFLDEPTTGLDPQSRLGVWEVVKQFRDGGGTVLVTTHYMDEAESVCDRLAIVERGQVAALGSPRDMVRGLDATQVLTFETERPLEQAIANLPGVRACRIEECQAVISSGDIAATLSALLAEMGRSGNALRRMSTREPTLEDVFFHITGRGLRDA